MTSQPDTRPGTASDPPAPLFEGITSRDDAVRLYMSLERSRDVGDWPGGPDWCLSEARGELLVRIRNLYDLDAYRRGPSPDQVVREAALWRAAAARTGLRDSDFDPQLLGAGTWEREHLRAAAVFLLAGYDNAAGAELGLAMTVAAPGSEAGSLIGRLRARLGEAAAQARAEDPSAASMTGITTRKLREELRDLGFSPGKITALTEAALSADARGAPAGGAGSSPAVTVSAGKRGQWNLLIGPYGTGRDAPGVTGALASLTAGKTIPVVYRQTGQYAFVTGRQPQGGTVEVRDPDGSPGRVAAMWLVPAVTVLDTGLDTAVELAHDLGIAPAAGPGMLRYGSPYTAWVSIARATGLYMNAPAVEAAEVAASRATGLGDPGNANGAPRDSVPWARAACQALRVALSVTGQRPGGHVLDFPASPSKDVLAAAAPAPRPTASKPGRTTRGRTP
jgi:hypothetical protein